MEARGRLVLSLFIVRVCGNEHHTILVVLLAYDEPRI